MTGREDYSEYLRWAIDRQKSDYSEMRNQLRKYLIGVLSVAIGGGAAWYRTDIGNLFQPEPKSLKQFGLLWQMNLLPSDSAAFFVDVLEGFAWTIGTMGVVFVFLSLTCIYTLESASRCVPVSNFSVVSEGEISQLENWVEENDDILVSMETARTMTLRFGKHGVVLILISLFTLLMADEIIIISFMLAMYGFVVIFSILEKDEVVAGTRFRAAIGGIIIFLSLMEPFSTFQDVYGYLPTIYPLMWFSFTAIIISVYLREEIRAGINRINPVSKIRAILDRFQE